MKYSEKKMKISLANEITLTTVGPHMKKTIFADDSESKAQKWNNSGKGKFKLG